MLGQKQVVSLEGAQKQEHLMWAGILVRFCWGKELLVFFLYARIFQGLIISTLASCGSTQTPRTISSHFSNFSFWATNSPIYVSGLSWTSDLFLQLLFGYFPHISHTYLILTRPKLDSVSNFIFWISTPKLIMYLFTRYLRAVLDSFPSLIPHCLQFICNVSYLPCAFMLPLW